MSKCETLISKLVNVCAFAEEDHDHHLLCNLGCGLGVQYRRNSGLLESPHTDEEEQINQTYIYHTVGDTESPLYWGRVKNHIKTKHTKKN